MKYGSFRKWLQYIATNLLVLSYHWVISCYQYYSIFLCQNYELIGKSISHILKSYAWLHRNEWDFI